MKNLIKLLLFSPLLFMACTDEMERYTLASPTDTMKMTASNDTIALSEDAENTTALTFKWNNAANRGANTTLTYYFKMDIADNSFASSIQKIEIPEGNNSISFTHKQLNNYIIQQWGITAGESADIEAEIIASVTDSLEYMKPEISTTKVHITSYVHQPKNLYLIGSATTAELDPKKAIKMTEVYPDSVYVWNGNLGIGTFKMIKDMTNLLPSYNMGDNDSTLVYRTSENDADKMFPVESVGKYSIYIDKVLMKIAYSYIPYETAYMVGDAAPCGWNIDSPTPLNWSAKNPEVFTYEGPLNSGELKFPLSTGQWNCDYLMPIVADTSIVGNPNVDDNQVHLVHFVGGSNPDQKWKIVNGGNYKITLNVIKMTVTFQKE